MTRNKYISKFLCRCLFVLLLLGVFGGNAIAQSTATIGTGTLTTNGTSADPIERYYNYEHFQMVWTAAELTAAGMPAGAVITGLGFSVSESASSLANFTISMGHTSQSSASPGITTGLSVVKSSFTYAPVVQAAGSFDMITFTTPFTWNGTSNIVVNTCTGSNPFASPYGGVRYTTGATVTFLRTDGTSNCASTTTSTTTNRPNIRFSYTASTPCSGLPTAGTIPSSTTVCNSSPVASLSITGTSIGTGITYQWEESLDGINGWANAVGGSGATSSTYTTPSLTVTKYYRCLVTCTNSSQSAYSNVGSVSVLNCTYDVSYSQGATWSSIMPANGGSGQPMSGWQSASSGDDNTTTTQSLAGTTFKFQGLPVTGFQACSNGWMTFNTANTSVQWTNSLTSTGQSKVLAPFWDDLVFTGQNYANRDNCIRYLISGTLGSGSAVITIEWAGLERYNIPGPNLNFQVKLYESNNNIEFIYGNFEGFDGTVTSSYSYSCGYNGASPSGTTAADRFAMQTAVTNHFSASADPASHVVMPNCYSKFILTPGTYTGPISAPIIPAPINDNAVNAQALSVNAAPCTSYCGTYYTSRNATNSSVGTACATTAGFEDDDVWFIFNTTLATSYKIDLRSSPGYDGVLQILDAAFTPITCANATGAGLVESITANGLTAGGTTYYVRVYHNGTTFGGSGQFSLCISEVILPPANDNICGAISLTPGVGCTATSSIMPNTLAATASPEASCGGTPTADVWYSFVAATASDLITVQSGVGYNAQVQVFSSSDNTCNGTLTSLGCVNNTSTAGVETFSGSLVPGNLYFVRVYHTLGGAASGNFTICVTGQIPSCILAPTAPINGGGSGACANAAVTLSWPASSGATSYKVILDGNTVSLSQTSLTFNAGVLSPGTHVWSVIPINGIGMTTGCGDWSFAVSAMSCNAPTVSIANACANSPFTVTSNVIGGGAPFTYTWNDGNGGMYTNASSINASMPAGTYTISCTVADACGDFCSSSTVVTVNSLPLVTLTSSSEVYCVPGTGVSLTAGGANVYSYSPSSSLSAASGSVVTATPSVATSYTVIGTDALGCSNTAIATLNVGASVTMNSVSATPNTFCHVGATSLVANATLPGSSYCSAAATTAGCTGTDESIDNVTFGSINNNSSCPTGIQYQDFTNLSTAVTAGSSYPISIHNLNTFSGDQVTVWIDWNQNADFNDAGETYTLSYSQTSTGNISVPNGALNGQTRMRVRLNYTGAMSPCGNTTYGEVEDYSVYVSGGIDPVPSITYQWSQNGSSILGGSNTFAESASNITSSTIYTVIATSAAGCTATGTVSVIDKKTASTISITANGCYTWPVNGATYSNSGTYMGTLSNSNSVGCDSVITMNLTLISGVSIAAKAILNGPYDAVTGLMNDGLRINNKIPTIEPYSVAPYSRLPIGGPGGETVSPAILAISGNNAIVDWVMLEVRSSINSSVILVNKRALIQRDGDIVSNEDGISPVFLPGLASGNYYISVKHRNHLGNMTAVPIVLSSCANSVIDFTSIPVWVKAGEANPPRKMVGTIATMWAADANFNKNVKYNGLSNDKDAILNALGGNNYVNSILSPVYRAEDLNMDATVRFNGLDNDKNVIANMIGVTTPNNLINQHTPN